MNVFIRSSLRALRHKNYRLFFAGQAISLIGTWMTRIATAWLVYRLTHSAVMLGVVSFAGQIPTFLVAPFAGVLADRWNLRRTILITQILAMIQSLLLAVLTLGHWITLPQIIWLSIFQGMINGFDMPARQSFLNEIVKDPADLGNAIALNSSIVNGARLVGPSLAGIVIAVSGEGMCFLIDGISYIAAVFALLAMNVLPKVRHAHSAKMLHSLREGALYAFRFTPIRSILLLLSLISFMGMPYAVLMPIYAARLGAGPYWLGFLTGASGCGALAAGLFLASRRSVRGLGQWIPISTALCGGGLIVFVLSREIFLSLTAVFITGFGMMMAMAASNTILQTIAEDDKRGRIMSFFTMAFVGMAPLGSLTAGFAAEKIGPDNTLILGGLFCLLGALIFSRELPELRKLIRPIYIEKGIIKAGVQAAAVAQAAD